MKNEDKKRSPRSVRKNMRRRKAALRRELPAAEAERAIARLTRDSRR